MKKDWGYNTIMRIPSCSSPCARANLWTSWTRVLFLMLIAGLLSTSAWAQSRQALLVGVASYPTETDWSSPLAAHVDLEILNAALLRQGFEAENIRALKDPTKRELVQALISLAERVESGGVAVFHFSGHGQPVIDVDGDEPTGLDQSLVPSDANRLPGSPWTDEQGELGVYFGQNHLIDDELAGYLEAIRRKLGPEGQLVCVLDACHSGSATRGPGQTRGTPVFMRTSADASASKTVNLTMTTPWIDRSESEWDLAPMIAFFACASNQLNYEYTQERARGQYKNVGSLSFAFASALEQLPSNQKTWAMFVAYWTVSWRQSPRTKPLILMGI